MADTYAEQIATRFRAQAAPLNISPERLLIQELTSIIRAYNTALEILEKNP